MSDTATASAGPAPTAIEPSRVLVLDEDEQHILLAALERLARERERDGIGDAWLVERLHKRVALGEEYINPTDELVRTTLRKRRLEGEIRRCNIAIERTTEQVVEELAERGDTGGKHAATGASYRIDRKVWARVHADVDGLPRDEAERQKAAAKAQAGQVMRTMPELAGFVREDFNLQTLSAYFREQIKQWDSEQRELPEHQRTPRPASDFLPAELRGLIELDDTPTITVRA